MKKQITTILILLILSLSLTNALSPTPGTVCCWDHEDDTNDAACIEFGIESCEENLANFEQGLQNWNNENNLNSPTNIFFENFIYLVIGAIIIIAVVVIYKKRK